MRQPEPNNNAVMDLSGANKRHDDDRPLVMVMKNTPTMIPAYGDDGNNNSSEVGIFSSQNNSGDGNATPGASIVAYCKDTINSLRLMTNKC
jgi:hypothetical protein